MALLQSPSGSVIQVTGRLEERLLTLGWTVTNQPAAAGLSLVTAAALAQLASTVTVAVGASAADRADLRQILEPIAEQLPEVAAEVDDINQTITATTAATATKPTPRTDALEAWRAEDEPKIDALHPVATSGDYTALTNKPTIPTVGTTAGTVAAGNDPRLSDARLPIGHTHPAAQVTGLANVATGGTLAAASVTGLHAVATSGDYQALSNKPTIPVGMTAVKITSDQPFTATGLANVTGLAIPVTAGQVTRFTFTIAFRTAALTTGIRLGVTTPAFTTFAGTVTALFAADGADALFEGALTSSGDAVVTTAVPAINTDYLATVEGLILPSANGTVQLQAATEVNASAATVRAGSHGVYLTV